MIEPLMNLLVCVLVSMLGAYCLHELWGLDFWPATAGCFYALVLSKAIQSS